MLRAARHHHTEFSEMRPQGVDQTGALPHQQVACPMDQQHRLLRFILIGTNRIEGRVTASQIAAASARSFFWRRT